MFSGSKTSSLVSRVDPCFSKSAMMAASALSSLACKIRQRRNILIKGPEAQRVLMGYQICPSFYSPTNTYLSIEVVRNSEASFTHSRPPTGNLQFSSIHNTLRTVGAHYPPQKWSHRALTALTMRGSAGVLQKDSVPCEFEDIQHTLPWK